MALASRIVRSGDAGASSSIPTGTTWGRVTNIVGGSSVNDSSHTKLEQATSDVLDAIHNLEAQITSIAAEVRDLNAELTDERTTVQQEREEMDIYHSLETGTPYLVAAPGTAHLRAREKELLEAAIRASTLERRLLDFASVLTVSGRQLSSEGELLNVDAATELALRIARIQSQEDERRRFAREIHDGPAQAFANAIIGLEFVERAIKMEPTDVQSPALSEIERIKGSLREGLTEIRRFMFDLKPTMLQDRGLVATIEHYITTYRSILPMDVSLQIEDQLPPLTKDQEMTAFRVIQESLHNATKYARASQVSVEIRTVAPEGVAITIRDNGRGFDPAQITVHSMGGTGIKGMRERAELVGASFRVDSVPGEGTCVHLVLPGSPSDA